MPGTHERKPALAPSETGNRIQGLVRNSTPPPVGAPIAMPAWVVVVVGGGGGGGVHYGLLLLLFLCVDVVMGTGA